MDQRFVVRAAAWLEIIVGALFIAVPDLLSRLLFGAGAEAISMPLGRFAGIGLIALGVACLPPRGIESTRNAVLGLSVFNIGVVILLAWVGVATAFHGLLLWPAVVLHTVLAGALLPHLLGTGSAKSHSPTA